MIVTYVFSPSLSLASLSLLISLHSFLSLPISYILVESLYIFKFSSILDFFLSVFLLLFPIYLTCHYCSLTLVFKPKRLNMKAAQKMPYLLENWLVIVFLNMFNIIFYLCHYFSLIFCFCHLELCCTFVAFSKLTETLAGFFCFLFWDFLLHYY